MRAAAQNPASARLVGIRVGWMLAIGWGLAAAIGAIAGMMAAPIVYLDPNMMAGVLLYAFAGAVLGGIDNPWGAVFGGFVGRRRGEPDRRLCRRRGGEARRRAGDHRRRAGRQAVGPVRPAHRGEGLMTHRLAPTADQALSRWRGRWRSFSPSPRRSSLSGYHLYQFTQVLIVRHRALGLNLLTGYNGQISLGHGAFFALGGYGAAILIANFGLPFWASIPLAERRLLRRRLPVRLSRAEIRRPLSRARDLRARRRRAADALLQGLRRLDRRHAGRCSSASRRRPLALHLTSDQWTLCSSRCRRGVAVPGPRSTWSTAASAGR